MLGVGLFHNSSKAGSEIGTLSPDCDFIAIFRDNDNAVALGKNGLGSRTNEETLLGLGQCQLDGRKGGSQTVDCLLDGVDCTTDSLALSANGDFSGCRVERKVDFFTSSGEERGSASNHEGKDVCWNIADALSRLADLGRDMLLNQTLSLKNSRLGAGDFNGNNGFLVIFVIGLRGVSTSSAGGLFALGDVDADVCLFTNPVKIRS